LNAVEINNVIVLGNLLAIGDVIGGRGRYHSLDIIWNLGKWTLLTKSRGIQISGLKRFTIGDDTIPIISPKNHTILYISHDMK